MTRVSIDSKQHIPLSARDKVLLYYYGQTKPHVTIYHNGQTRNDNTLSLEKVWPRETSGDLI